MLGSALNISEPNVVLNTAVAEALKQIADILEAADDFDSAVHDIVKRVYSNHKKIIFNGDGYSDEWQKEAAKRGLPNFKTVPDAIPHLKDEKNIKLFTDHKIYTEQEVVSRAEIMFTNYCKTISHEAYIMSDMVKRQILPAVQNYIAELSSNALNKKALGISALAYESDTLRELSENADKLYKATLDLDKAANKLPKGDTEKVACHYRDKVCPLMKKVREYADILETITADEYWPFPTYKDLLYGVN